MSVHPVGNDPELPRVRTGVRAGDFTVFSGDGDVGSHLLQVPALKSDGSRKIPADNPLSKGSRMLQLVGPVDPVHVVLINHDGNSRLAKIYERVEKMGVHEVVSSGYQ